MFGVLAVSALLLSAVGLFALTAHNVAFSELHNFAGRSDGTIPRGRCPRGMLEIRRLTKRYGALTAIHDVSFDVRSGEVLGSLPGL
ncbi:MAG: hypothetical protein ABJA98_19685 [Acidobacteriota bacterium]